MSDDSTHPGPPRAYLLAAALVSAATLALQVALTRVLSVSLWYSFAFLVVSTAILGYGIAGMTIAMRPRLASGDVGRRLPWLAAGFGVSIAVCWALLDHLPFEPFRLLASPGELALGVVYLVTMLVPFLFSGLVMGVLFTRFARQAPRLYAFDLAGAGVGAVGVLFAFAPFGGSGTVLLTAAIALGAAAAFARPRRLVVALGGGALLVLALAFVGDRMLPVRITADKTVGNGGVPVSRLLASPRMHLATRWNALSRLDLVAVRGRRFILIDGGVAVTRLPRVPVAADPPPMRDVTSLAFDLVPTRKVLIVGSGGGWEVYGALTHGAREVTAVEVNPGIVAWVRGLERGYLHGLFERPEVHLVTDEARSFLRRSHDRYDVIVMAHTISNAATAAGALNLVESYTLTREAVRDELDHLAPGGILYVTRPEVQLPKLVRTARQVLLARGARHPETQLAVVSRPPLARGQPTFTTGLLVGARPFTTDQLATLEREIAEWHLETLYLPGQGRGGIWERLARGQLAPEEMRRASLTPATDDRPFFDRRRRWTELRLADVRRVFTQGTRGRLALEDQPVSAVSVATLLALSILVAFVFTFVPLWWGRRRGDFAPPGRAPMLAYFACLGLAFLFVELGLVHALTLFVGPPTVTFAVVLGGLLVSSGIGARLAVRRSARPRVLALVVLAVGLVALLAPPLTRALLGLPLVVRALVAVGIVAPAGLAMGMPFPLGLELCGERAPSLVPLAFGVNGFFSVIAGAGSVVLATSLGFTSVLAAGIACYVGAGVCLMAGRGQMSTPPRTSP